jgi:ribosomal-protein-alanine N-acetyltransferase
MAKMLNSRRLSVKCRFMLRRDMEEVMAIEQESYDDPWTYDDFKEALGKRNVIGFVAEHGDEVVGFIIYELMRSRVVMQNLAVAWQYRRRGVGEFLVGKLVGKLSQQRARIVCDVRDTNLGCHLFLRYMGFRALNVLRLDNGNDAYHFVYRLPKEED